jgi:hypothetical protein
LRVSVVTTGGATVYRAVAGARANVAVETTESIRSESSLDWDSEKQVKQRMKAIKKR